MKEKIVIEKEVLERLIKALPIQWFDNKEKTDKVVIFGKEYETMQVPENFADLLTLCKDTKGCFVLRVSDREYIEVPTDLIGYSFTFYQDGQIFADEDVCVKEKATPQQMWKIIKSLMGAE